MQCPQCGGEMWDNRQNKTNPKAPDFKCKDPNCLDDKGYVTAVWDKPKGNFTPKGGKNEVPTAKPNGNGKNDPVVRKEIIRQNALTNAVNYCTSKAQLDKEYELSGKGVIQVATYFARYSEGKETVVPQKQMEPTMEPTMEEINEVFGE